MSEQEVMLYADNAHELLSEMIMALLDEAAIEDALEDGFTITTKVCIN